MSCSVSVWLRKIRRFEMKRIPTDVGESQAERKLFFQLKNFLEKS